MKIFANDRIRSAGASGPLGTLILVWPDSGILTVQPRKRLLNCFSFRAISVCFCYLFNINVKHKIKW